MKAFSRRNFIRTAAAGTGGLLVVSSCMAKNGNRLFFTDEEVSLMESIVECFIPEDDFPGAKEADVVRFIDRQLLGYHSRYQSAYRNGLAAFREGCISHYKQAFINLSPAHKIAFLESVEKNNITGVSWGDMAPGEFFSLILDHTMQGFYGSPRHGGNKNYTSYHMLKLDYPLIIGRNKYSED
jgi:gluconate 2-dehydrogenase gamma chain